MRSMAVAESNAASDMVVSLFCGFGRAHAATPVAPTMRAIKVSRRVMDRWGIRRGERDVEPNTCCVKEDRCSSGQRCGLFRVPTGAGGSKCSPMFASGIKATVLDHDPQQIDSIRRF